VSHLMLIVAATALGIVGTRQCDEQMRLLQIDRRNLANWFTLASPLLLSLSLALTAARLLPPRPRFLEVFQQPGLVANWITCLIAGFNAITMFSMNMDKLSSVDGIVKLFRFAFFWPTASDAGGGVLIAWMTLAMAGCWRAEPSWIDRSGRVLGVVSIISFLANKFSWMLWLP
jgi:hypothetical protein